MLNRRSDKLELLRIAEAVALEKSIDKEIILSSYNKKDIDIINVKYLKGLKFIYVDTMAEVITNALTNRKVVNSKLI